MNDTAPNPSAAIFDAADPAAAKAGFNPHLVFYHPNGRGNGAAIRFSVEPATADRDGAVFFSIAKQNGTAGSTPEQKFASFDWANRTTVKLNFVEVAEILMVFGGQASALSHAGKDGLYHNSAQATTSVELKRSEDPGRPGYLLGVGRTPKADPNARQYHAFVFRPAEAVGLRLALQAEMGLLAFGVPRERAPGGRDGGIRPAAGAFPPPPAPAPGLALPSAAAPADGGFGDAF